MPREGVTIIADNAVGALFYDILVDEKDISALLKRVSQVRDAAQKSLEIKDSGLGKAFKDAATAGAPLEAQLKDLATASGTVQTSFTGIGKTVSSTRRELSPLQQAIKGLANETASYRNIVESTDVSNRDAVANFTRLKTTALELANGLEVTSTEYRNLTQISRQAASSMKTLEGQQTRLGFSGNTVVGVNTAMRRGFMDLSGAVQPLLGAVGFVGLSNVMGDLATQANAVNVSYDILELTMDRVGASSSAVQDSISNTAASLGVAEGQVVDYATQLLRMGVAAEQIDDVLIAGGSSALAFGKTAAQGIESVTSALVTQNSQNLNTIGIAENIGAAMGEAADGAAEFGEAASKQAAAQEGVNIILEATADEVASLDKLTGGLAGSQSRAATSAYEAKQALGEMLIPIETLKNEAIVGLLDGFNQIPEASQASIVGIGGITGAVAVLATGANALRLALIPLFAPPAGLIIAGVAAAAALGVAIYNATKEFEPAAEKVQRLADAALNVPPGLDAITKATSKEQLLGAVQTLSETMDGDARTAFTNYATDAVTSAATVGQAVIGVLQGIAVARQTMLQDAIDAQEELLATLEENVARSTTNFNIATATGNDGTESQELTRLREELAQAKALVEETQAAITEATREGNTERNEILRGQLEEDQALVIQITGEIGEALNNTPTGRLNIDTSAAQQAQRDLAALQERYDELVDLIENGDAQQLEDYFSAGATGAQALSGSLDGGDGTGGVAESAGNASDGLDDFISKATTASRVLGEVSAGVIAAQIQFQDTMLASTGVSIIPEGSAEVLSDYQLKAEQLFAAIQEGPEAVAALSQAWTEQRDAQEAAAEAQDIWSRSVQGVTVDLLTAKDVTVDVAGSVGILGEEFENLATVADEVALPIPEVSAEYRDYLEFFEKDLKDALETGAEEAELFGEVFNATAEEAEFVRAAMEELLAQGLEPNDEAVQELSERYLELQESLEETAEANERYEKNLDATREAQEGLADAASLSDVEILKLLKGIEDATDGAGELGRQATETKLALLELQAARDVAEDFAFLGEISRIALESIPNLSQEAAGGLAFLAGAGQTAAKVLQDGFNGVGDVLSILEAGVSSVADALGSELTPEARGALTAVEGAVSGAAAGFAVGGPIGAAIGGFIGLIGGIGQAAKEAAEEAAAAFEELADLLTSVKRDLEDLTIDTGQSAIDLAESQGASPIDLLIAQTQLDLEELENNFREQERKIGELNDELVAGFIKNGMTPEEAQAAADAQTDPLYDALNEKYTNDVALIIGEAEQAANDLGVSDEKFANALKEPSDILTDAGVDIRDSFGSFIGIYQGEIGSLSTTMLDGSATLNASATNFGVSGGAALNQSASTLSKAADSLFGSLTSTISNEAPKTYKELREQIDKTTLAFEVSIYGSGGLNSTLQRGTTGVTGLLEGFFGAQRRTVTTEANSTVGSINQATFDIQRAMRDLIGASGGSSSFRGSTRSGGGGGGGSRGAVGLFQSMSETIDPRIMGGFGDDFTMSSLLYGNPEDEFGQSFHRDSFGYGTGLAEVERANSGGGGRGLKNSFFKNLLRSITDDVDKLKKGSVSQLNSAIRTLQKGKDALQREVERGTPKRKNKKPSNPLAGMNDEVRQTIKDTQASLESFWDSFDIISGGALVYRGKKLGGQTYKAGGLLAGLLGNKIDFRKGLSEAQQEIISFAQQFGTGLEQNVSSGISGGIKAALQSGGVADFQSIMQSISGSVFDGLFNQLSGPILQKALGGLLTDLTADVTKGDVAGATDNVNKIAGKLPQVMAQIQAILAPLQGVLQNGSSPAAATSTGGITLEQRSLGSASPTWVTTMTNVSTVFSRAADQMYLAGEKQLQAALKLERLATSSGNRYNEILKNGKSSKL